MQSQDPSSTNQADHRARERALAEAIRLRRWRQRRIGYGMLTVLAGTCVPTGSLMLAGAISGDGFWNWIAATGWLPLLLTLIGGALAALIAFLRGWGVSLGMISFGVLFIVLITITRAVIGTLLPAMPGLVALFVTGGALVGYLTTLEDGD